MSNNTTQLVSGSWKVSWAGSEGDDMYLVYPVPYRRILKAIERDSIARLIAATPAMYAALQRVNTDLSFDDDSHSAYYAINEDDAEAIRAAIAKATGKDL